jgi:hypothetical protein
MMDSTNLRPEVRELMRVSERLIGFAHQNNGSLSNDDCDAVLFYIKELQNEIMPYCSAHNKEACSK